MRALLDASMGIAATLDEQEIVERLARETCRLLDARGALAEVELAEPGDVARYVAGEVEGVDDPPFVVPLRGRGAEPVGSLGGRGLPTPPTSLHAAIAGQPAHG